MTPGTSPRPGGNFAMRAVAAVRTAYGAAARLPVWLPDLRTGGPGLARVAAVLYLGGLCIILTTAWHDPGMGPGGMISSVPGWHLAFLLVTGATASLLAVVGDGSGREGAGEAPVAPTTGLSELMAQMSHELRTPLNAVIGFSEVMQRELYGPLGNARYQEYAHHISESGGRLLKSSEEALAITEAMTALMADRQRGKRERLLLGPLVRDAWRGASNGMRDSMPKLTVTTCNTCEVMGERRPAMQALEHLLREAIARAAGGGAVEIAGRRQAGRRLLEICVRRGPDPSQPTLPASRTGAREGSDRLGGSLRVILARLLLETQGATLACKPGEGGAWFAVVEFPAKA
jgi:signal transduction histidine kinase